MRRWFPSVIVLAVAVGLVGWREWTRPATAAGPSPPTRPRVVLYVDLGEVDEDGGCGAIIRSVRDAGKRGFVVEEIDARSEAPTPEKYRLLIAPTVLVLDPAGKEEKRFEGEAAKTVREIRSALEKLPAAR